MPRLVWSPEALNDVARLHAFLASKNRDAAKRAVAAIRHGVMLLRDHSQVGRLIDDMPPEFREWPIIFGRAGYVAIYRYDDQDVVILPVRHGRETGY